jgi:hypothetical protein
MELINDLRSAGRTILKQPSMLLLPAAAMAQGLVLNGLVIVAARHAVAIQQAAHYVKFLITLS